VPLRFKGRLLKQHELTEKGCRRLIFTFGSFYEAEHHFAVIAFAIDDRPIESMYSSQFRSSRSYCECYG
jgi:hypothetical protein